MLPDSILPTPEDDIARILVNLEKRVSSLERLEGGGALTLIEDVKLTVDAATIDFQNIPQIYRNLILTWSLRSDRPVVTDDLRMRINNLSDAFYDWMMYLIGHANSFTTAAGAADTAASISFTPAGTAPGNRFGPGWLLFPDYADAGTSPGWRSWGGAIRGTGNTSFLTRDSIGTHRVINAISRITLLPANGPNFVTLSQASLYGAA